MQQRFFAIFFAVTIILTASAPNIGLTWDEPAYIVASETHMEWFRQLLKDPSAAFRNDMIMQYWKVNHEHPAIGKIWSGFAWVATKWLFDDLTAHRFGNILLASLLAGTLYLWSARISGPRAGIFSVAALMTMPRFFFHSHLGSLDVPVTFLIFLVIYVFWRTIEEDNIRITIFLGVILGIALAAKINAVLVPVIIGVWVLLFKRRPKVFLRLVLMNLIALAAFVVLWPWLYFDTLHRLKEYISFVSWGHFEAGQWYFGTYYVHPPWHYPFVILLVVTPLTIAVLAVIAAIWGNKSDEHRSLVWLLVLSTIIPLGVLSSGKSMVYDNDRLLLPVFPFIAMLSGYGFQRVLEKVEAWMEYLSKRAIFSRLFAIILALVLISSQLYSLVCLYPHLLSYYSEIVGGLPGANRLGFETTYWSESYKEALPFINDHAEIRDRIWADPWSYDVLAYYQVKGYLRKDVIILVQFQKAESVYGEVAYLAPGDYRSADWMIFQYRQSVYGAKGYNSDLADFLKDKPPLLRVSRQGIPIMDLYHK